MSELEDKVLEDAAENIIGKLDGVEWWGEQYDYNKDKIVEELRQLVHQEREDIIKSIYSIEVSGEHPGTFYNGLETMRNMCATVVQSRSNNE